MDEDNLNRFYPNLDIEEPDPDINYKHNMSKQKGNSWSNYAVRIIVSTASHPLEYAKVLIQIGHEPIAPRPTTTLFGRPALKLPNIFEYVRYIKSVDGLVGCYRGFVPKVCGNLASAIASQKVIDHLESDKEDEEELSEADEDKRTELFLKSVKKDLVTRATAIVVSHPFHVVTIRIMAQFVGNETTYNGLFASIMQIYKESGVKGFFSGLVPRILGDVFSLLLASALAYAFNTYVFEDKELQMYTSATMSFIASAITYPFQVVSNCMAVAGTSLAAGSPPNMPFYNSWLDCWSDLSRRNQLKRGSSLLIRYYVGPQLIIGGRAIPSDKNFEFMK
uniref:Mitochondrial carrier homolog 2 n=1 Tax=Photinus pyralis TaxID=7054 RepID=A0A1Y1MQ24_PHOPY